MRKRSRKASTVRATAASKRVVYACVMGNAYPVRDEPTGHLPPGPASIGTAPIDAVLQDDGLAVGLWFERTHRALMPLGIALHAVLFWSLPVSTFSATMLLLYLAFVDPDRVHTTVQRLTDGAPA